LGEVEERDNQREEWLKMWMENHYKKLETNPYKKFAELREEKKEEEERNDVFIYKTLKYPPKSTPPTKD